MLYRILVTVSPSLLRHVFLRDRSMGPTLRGKDELDKASKLLDLQLCSKHWQKDGLLDHGLWFKHHRWSKVVMDLRHRVPQGQGCTAPWRQKEVRFGSIVTWPATPKALLVGHLGQCHLRFLALSVHPVHICSSSFFTRNEGLGHFDWYPQKGGLGISWFEDWSAEWYFLSLAGGTSVLVTAPWTRIV